MPYNRLKKLNKFLFYAFCAFILALIAIVLTHSDFNSNSFILILNMVLNFVAFCFLNGKIDNLIDKKMKGRKPKKQKPPRRQIDWNTGTRIHKPKKGKGSYVRRKR